MPANTAPVCPAHLVEIPFFKERLQLKALFIIKLFWLKTKIAAVSIQHPVVNTLGMLFS